MAQFLPRSWQLREERENLLTAGCCCDAPHAHMKRRTKLSLYTPKCSSTKWKPSPFLEDGLAHHGSQPQCSCWKESPKHPIPAGRKDRRIILSQDTTFLRNTTGNDNPAKENHPFTSLGRDLPSHQGGLIPKKPQSALSSRDPGPGTVPLLHLISPTNGPEGTSCGRFSFEYHGAEAGEELGPLPEQGGICWSCGSPTKSTYFMLQSG